MSYHQYRLDAAPNDERINSKLTGSFASSVRADSRPKYLQDTSSTFERDSATSEKNTHRSLVAPIFVEDHFPMKQYSKTSTTTATRSMATAASYGSNSYGIPSAGLTSYEHQQHNGSIGSSYSNPYNLVNNPWDLNSDNVHQQQQQQQSFAPFPWQNQDRQYHGVQSDSSSDWGNGHFSHQQYNNYNDPGNHAVNYENSNSSAPTHSYCETAPTMSSIGHSSGNTARFQSSEPTAVPPPPPLPPPPPPPPPFPPSDSCSSPTWKDLQQFPSWLLNHSTSVPGTIPLGQASNANFSWNPNQKRLEIKESSSNDITARTSDISVKGNDSWFEPLQKVHQHRTEQQQSHNQNSSSTSFSYRNDENNRPILNSSSKSLPPPPPPRPDTQGNSLKPVESTNEETIKIASAMSQLSNLSQRWNAPSTYESSKKKNQGNNTNNNKGKTKSQKRSEQRKRRRERESLARQMMLVQSSSDEVGNTDTPSISTSNGLHFFEQRTDGYPYRTINESSTHYDSSPPLPPSSSYCVHRNTEESTRKYGKQTMTRREKITIDLTLDDDNDSGDREEGEVCYNSGLNKKRRIFMEERDKETNADREEIVLSRRPTRSEITRQSKEEEGPLESCVDLKSPMHTKNLQHEEETFQKLSQEPGLVQDDTMDISDDEEEGDPATVPKSTYNNSSFEKDTRIYVNNGSSTSLTQKALSKERIEEVEKKEQNELDLILNSAAIAAADVSPIESAVTSGNSSGTVNSFRKELSLSTSNTSSAVNNEQLKHNDSISSKLIAVTKETTPSHEKALAANRERLARALQKLRLEKAKAKLRMAQKKKEEALKAKKQSSHFNGNENKRSPSISTVRDSILNNDGQISPKKTGSENPPDITAITTPSLWIVNIASSGPPEKVRRKSMHRKSENGQRKLNSFHNKDTPKDEDIIASNKGSSSEGTATSSVQSTQEGHTQNIISLSPVKVSMKTEPAVPQLGTDLNDTKKKSESLNLQLELLKRRLRLKQLEKAAQAKRVCYQHHKIDGAEITLIEERSKQKNPITKFEASSSSSNSNVSEKVVSTSSLDCSVIESEGTKQASRATSSSPLRIEPSLSSQERVRQVDKLRERQRELKESINSFKENNKELKYRKEVRDLNELVTKQRKMLIQQGKKLQDCTKSLKQCSDEIAKENKAEKITEKELEEMLKRKRMMNSMVMSVTAKLINARRKRVNLLKKRSRVIARKKSIHPDVGEEKR